MKDGKTPQNEAKMTKWVETARKEAKITVSDLAVVIGIDRRTYARKVRSDDGLTDRELCRALAFLHVEPSIFTRNDAGDIKIRLFG